MANPVAVTAGATNGAGPFVLTIPATQAGSALFILGINQAGGSRTIDSNGTGTGTYTALADNASFMCVWRCLNPQTGTTNTRISATGSGYSLIVVEMPGMDPAGASVISTFNSASTAAWTTNSISPAKASSSIVFAYEGSDSTTTTTIPGFNLPSGTGVVSGIAANAGGGNVSVIGNLDIAAGAGQTASGLWNVAHAWTSIYLAHEKLAGGGGVGGSSAMLGSAIMAC